MKLITSWVIHTGIVLIMRMNMDGHVSVTEGVVVSDEGEERVGVMKLDCATHEDE